MRYPYFILEGAGQPLSEDEKHRIKIEREAWHPSQIANDLSELAESNIGKTIFIQIQNPENYYDTADEWPKPFIAELEDVTREMLLDHDVQFDQLFIVLSNPRHLNGRPVLEEYEYDYEVLLQPQNSNCYKLNFNSVIKFGVEKKSFWKQLFSSQKGS